MYYEVTTKCGHVGKGKYVIISFPVMAKSKKEAAQIARGIPRVKHDHKDAIKEVKEISKERYEILKTNNLLDPYLKCSSIQEQRMIEDMDKRILEENKISEKEKENDCIWKNKILIRNYKKYLKFNEDIYEYAF